MIPETKIERRSLSALRPADYNPRRISDRALEGLRDSVTRFGLVQPIVVNDRTGNVVGGHQRLRVLESEGAEAVDVVVVDVTETEEKALNLALNNPHIGGEFTDSVDALLESLSIEAPDIFAGLRLDDLLAEVTGPVAPPPLPEDDARGGHADDGPPVTQRGDVWLLGRHRLICGDCRDAGDVERLLDGERVNVAFTSPPYASQRKYDESSGFKPIRPDEYVEWFSEVQANVRAHLADDGSWFVNIKAHCEDGQRHLYVHDLTIAHVREWGWLFVDDFCWRDTKNGVPGGWNNRFKDAWEPVFHFATSGPIKFRPLAVSTKSAAVFDYSASTATTKTGSGLLGEKATQERAGLARPSNVVEVAAASTGGHSAAFPVGLPAFFIRAYSDPDDVVFDPFMGSGTTIIACEKEGRRGYGCEISAGYCDVIVRRWQECAGDLATLDGDGRTFAEVKDERDAEG